MYRICYLLSKKLLFRALVSVFGNLIALFLSAPFTVLLVISHFLHFLFKWILLFIFNRSKNSEFFGIGRRILKGADCGWLEERWQESVLQAMLVFDSKIHVSRIQELITTRVIPLYPRLTYKICPLPFTAGSAHCWLPDDKYDINRHVFTDHVKLLSDDQLQIYVSKLISMKLPADKSPWELRVLSQSLDCSTTDTIIVLRVHQCLADGMTLIKILCTKLADTRASYTAFKSHFKFSYYLRLIQAFCVGPALIAYKLFTIYNKNKITTSGSGTKDAYAEHQQQHSRHQHYAGDTAENRCSVNWSTSISMCKVDRIKQVTRSSYNCVFLSAVTGGLRYVLQNSGIKHPPDLKITLPFVTGKNQKFIPVSTFVPISMEGAIPRLWQTKRQLKSLSSSRDLLVASFVIYVLMPLCPADYIPLLNKVLRKLANVQFSSIVGPATRLVIDGSPLKTIYPLLPCQSDLGISTAISTYVDQVYITVITHKSLENIGKQLLNFIEEQLDRMYLLLVNRTIPEDLGEDYMQNQFPDISELPVKELKCRMQAIQHELQRLSEMISYNEDDVKRFSHFKSEFNHIFKELRRRKSVKIRRPSVISQTIENFSPICAAARMSRRSSSMKQAAAVLFPPVSAGNRELFEDGVCDKMRRRHQQQQQNAALNFEENVQLLFYKKYASTFKTMASSRNSSFKGCSYTNTNKYIYLTLVNENSNLGLNKCRCPPTNNNNNSSSNNNNNTTTSNSTDTNVICNLVEGMAEATETVVGTADGAGNTRNNYICASSRNQHHPPSIYYELSENEQII